MTTLPDFNDTKKRLREAANRLRENVQSDQRFLAAQLVADAGAALIQTLGKKIIAGYHPIGSELDSLILLEALSRMDCIITLPVTPAENAPLLFRRWAPGEALRKGRFGVKEPSPRSQELDPDIVLAPLLAFDRTGHRLGYGGGFYDRTLHALRAEAQVVAIGIAFDEQEIDTLPHNDDDEALDWVLTPTGAWRFEG